MSKVIDERPASFCLPNCPFMDLDVDTQTAYADNSIAHVYNTVSCSHENVCKMWAEREDVHRTCKGCAYDEKSCTNPNPCETNEFGSRSGYTRKELNAEWFVMTSSDIDRYETKITAKCSSCGYVHNVASIDEETRMLASQHNTGLCIDIALNKIAIVLPKVCPGCLSKMTFRP